MSIFGPDHHQQLFSATRMPSNHHGDAVVAEDFFELGGKAFLVGSVKDEVENSELDEVKKDKASIILKDSAPLFLEQHHCYEGSHAKASNAKGMVIGFGNEHILHERQKGGLVWKIDESLGSDVKELPALEGDDSVSLDCINDIGLIGGSSFHSAIPERNRPALWFEKYTIPLPVPPSFDGGYVKDLDLHGMAVGEVSAADGRTLPAFWADNICRVIPLASREAGRFVKLCNGIAIGIQTVAPEYVFFVDIAGIVDFDIEPVIYPIEASKSIQFKSDIQFITSQTGTELVINSFRPGGNNLYYCPMYFKARRLIDLQQSKGIDLNSIVPSVFNNCSLHAVRSLKRGDRGVSMVAIAYPNDKQMPVFIEPRDTLSGMTF